jgi:hypothetical protein
MNVSAKDLTENTPSVIFVQIILSDAFLEATTQKLYYLNYLIFLHSGLQLVYFYIVLLGKVRTIYIKFYFCPNLNILSNKPYQYIYIYI